MDKSLIVELIKQLILPLFKKGFDRKVFIFFIIEKVFYK